VVPTPAPVVAPLCAVVTPAPEGAPPVAAPTVAAPPPAPAVPAAPPAVGPGAKAFPPGFLWGTATSSYQIEGAINEGGRGPSIWDTFCKQPGAVVNGECGTVATDHYHKYEEDLDLLVALGVKVYRFSIAWSRLYPNGETAGEPLPEGVAFYNNLIDGLVRRNITPAATLYHWDLPAALEHWAVESPKRDNLINAFGHYSRTCFRLYGDRVKHWLTLNEPWVAAIIGHVVGEHAPGHKEKPGTEGYVAAHALLLGHLRSARIYKGEFQAAQRGLVGLTLNSDWHIPFDAADPADVEAAARNTEFVLGHFAHPIFGAGDYPPRMKAIVGNRLPAFTAAEVAGLKGSADFFGLNHYTTRRVKAQAPWAPPEGNYWADILTEDKPDPAWSQTDMAWSVVPSGFKALLVHIQETYAPAGGIWVMENGLAAAGETSAAALNATAAVERQSFFSGYLGAMQEAITEGADVRAYCIWSLLDNCTTAGAVVGTDARGRGWASRASGLEFRATGGPRRGLTLTRPTVRTLRCPLAPCSRLLDAQSSGPLGTTSALALCGWTLRTLRASARPSPSLAGTNRSLRPTRSVREWWGRRGKTGGACRAVPCDERRGGLRGRVARG